VIEAAYTALRQNNWISINGSGHLRRGDSSRPLAPSAVGGA
jgi:hypothetical protein